MFSQCFGSHSHCRDPSPEELGKRWRQGRPLHESFFQIPLFRPTELKLEDIEECDPGYMDQGIQRTPLGTESRECPYTNNKHSIHDYLHSLSGDVSLCPSHSIINFDNRRMPPILQEVKCSCSTCAIDVEKTSSGHSANTTLQCIPVKYYTRVLRRTNECVNGTYKYQTVWEPLTLACECGQSKKITSKSASHRLVAASPTRRPRIHATNPGSILHTKPVPPRSVVSCDVWKKK
ncbi:hypothetical protein BaRGS_00020957 [Batillaria attramentaria]|uniref:Uncharacterized protein n=1 Tax=Batillaria attramentaria TaxID=370345 RepID=A0ABD0KL63_9CAEN